MGNLIKNRLKSKGGLLPFTLFIIVLMIWFLSILFILVKNEREHYYDDKKYNEKVYELDNFATLSQLELKRGDELINSGKYNDIIEYFEGKDRCWIRKEGLSESGYRRKEVVVNRNLKVNGDIELNKNQNSFLIKLEKREKILKYTAIYTVELLYEYKENERDFNNYSVRELKNFTVEYLE